MQPREKHLSVGTRQLLTFLRNKSGAKGYCWWKQDNIARNMERGLRTVSRQVSELVAASYLKSERHGHGNHYILCDLVEKMAYRAPSEEKPVDSAAVGVSDAPNWRIAPAPVSITEILEPEKIPEQSAYDQHCFENNGADAPAFEQDFRASGQEQKLSPESQSQNPRPGSGGNSGQAFDSEVAEIRGALKARPLVRLTAAFDPVIRSLLASGVTMEIIKRAILLGCWRKLKARHDRGDMSLIFSMRYFLGAIDDVQMFNEMNPLMDGTSCVTIAGPQYWRSLERRLGREEPRWISSQSPSGGRDGARSPLSAPTRLFGERVA